MTRWVSCPSSLVRVGSCPVPPEPGPQPIFNNSQSIEANAHSLSTASYLKDLRTNRPARPTGSRPYPGKSTTASSPDIEESLPPRAASAFSMYRTSGSPPKEEPRCESAMSHRRSNSTTAEGGPSGRPLAQEPRSVSVRKNVFPSQIFSRPVAASPVPSYRSYRESKQRHQEKEEARELRDALQGLNLEDDVRLHQAAQDEATELVWMHQNPGMAYKNPYAPYHNPDAVGREPSIRSQTRKSSGSGSSPIKHRHSIASSGTSSGPSSPEYTKAGLESSAQRRSSLAGNLKKNLKVNFALPEEEKPTPKPRTVSGESSKGVFRNPEDHIYEEPQTTDPQPDFSKSDSSALRNKPRNALPRLGKQLPWLQGRNTTGSVRDKISKFDIHKNPPSQSRDPGYTKNEPVALSPPSKDEEPIPMKDGKEIRSDDIRAATSKKLKDRSEKLPMPSAVSNRMGRPIVSFDPKWQPNDQPKPKPQSPTAAPPVPTITVAPSIEISEPQPPPPIPVINIPDIKEPTISEMSEPVQQQSKPGRSIPQPPGSQTRQPPVRRLPSEPQRHGYTPYTRSGVPTARCESCSLSISGKIVTAGGCRFHPECFICHHCHTALECVAFYEEPEASRVERLSHTQDTDEEARIPRFYCHLDFHELFSPRCKSCKTPIEGEVVVACGAEWHVGHFFCAECGDVSDTSQSDIRFLPVRSHLLTMPS